MPTDDDYGRRERLLLHQHPTSQYGQPSATVSSLPLSASISSSSAPSSGSTQQQYTGVSNASTVSTILGTPSSISTTDCYHKQQQQQSNQRSTSSSSSAPSSSSNVASSSIASHQDRYQINEKLQSSEAVSDYGSHMSHERYEKPIDKQQQQQQQQYANKNDDLNASKYIVDSSMHASTSRAIQSSIDNTRYVIASCQDQRLGQTTATSAQIGHHAYGSSSIVSGRSSNSSSCQTASTIGQATNKVHADRYTRYTEASSLSGDQRLSLQPIDRFQPIDNEIAQHNSYNHGRSVSSSILSGEERANGMSSGGTKTVTSEYANSSIITAIGSGNSAIGGCTPSGNVFSPDTFPSPPSPAPASDRFVPPPPLSPSPSEKYTSSQSLNAVCYSGSSCDRILPPGSPGNRDRCYVTAPASPMSKDVRYSAMSSERNNLVIDRIQTSLHEAKEHQQQQQQRYSAASTERLLSSASPVLGSMQSRDSENSRCGVFQVAAGLQDSGNVGVSSRYSISSDRLLSSSPINAPDRFAASAKAAERYHGNESPSHENQTRYHNHHHHHHHHRQELASTSLHHDRYSGASGSERYLSSSPNPEAAHGRYGTERVHLNSTGNERESRRYSNSERSLEGICQKYTDRGESRVCSSSGSPANSGEQYSCNRFPSFQEVTMQPRYPPDQRFGDIGSIQRYVTGQSSNAARLEQTRSNDRYLSNVSPGHDSRLVVSSDGVRYGNCGSSTERLLASTSSTSASDPARYHQSLYPGGTNNCGQTKNDRYGTLSPTPENNQPNLRSYSQQQCTTSKSNNPNPTTNDKYIQVSKSLQVAYGNGERHHQSAQMEQFERSGQERGYTIDRYGNSSNSSNNDQRYQVSGNNGAFHGVSADRYSPARAGHPDKYLSLPKPKDNFPTGRIVTSCSTLGVGGTSNSSISGSDRTYGTGGSASYVPPNAHTPVERYVPQPPPEVLYPERYADRYVSPAAHTPTDRYVPAADPGDPYMRRDLGFHHHYRLPPPGYPYHQSHFRFRSFAYASPGRLGGSPGSSSSSSSTSVQRELSTSPLLRSKARNSAIEIGNSGRQVNAASQATCCSDSTRNCCPPVRRSLPPGALPSIPNQSAHSSWQPSPSSGTTGTSTVSSSGTDGESTQSIGIYGVVGDVGKSEKSTTTTDPSSSPLVGSSNTGSGSSASGPNITRSVSAPAGPRPVVQQSISTNSTSAATSQRPRLRRNMSRTEALRNYIKRETATFFGVDEDSEVLEKQRWLDRRRRMASRKYGALLPEYKPPDPDITKDVPDSTEIPEGVTLRRWQQPVRRKDSVARMTLSGLHYMVETLTRQRPRERSVTSPESRSFPPSVISSISQAEVAPANDSAAVVEVEEEEEAFFLRPIPQPLPPQEPPPPPPPPPSSTSLAAAPATTLSQQIHDDKAEVLETGEQENTSGSTARGDPGLDLDRDLAEELVRFAPRKEERSSVDGHQVRRPRAVARDHYTSRKTSWRRSRQHDGRSICDPATGSQQEAGGVILRRELSGGTRISPSTIDRVFDNSNRRQYGMGIVGRLFGRSFRKSVAHKPDVRKQLDDIEDHRPFFTYWITTVQVFILIISLACYGFGPVGIDLNRRSGLVLVTSLSLQQVDYDEPANFWLGPRAADLIHLGAKFGPCMRRDLKILNEIDVWRERERDTACCIRNDDSGCVQSSKADCSNTISTWKKWVPGDSGPGGRISGSVCGLDPKFCDAPASVAPYEWPDDITKWPICRKTNPFSQRFRSNNGHQQGNNNFPIGRYKDKMAEHMVCEVIGHPCCIGIHGMCRITTKEYCDFVHGYFHEEASLCSQVECLHDVCGMMPFLHPEWPDQFYRLFTTTFLHAGILHLAITLLVQYFLMRDLEKLTGSLRIALIYFVGALAGNLASAIFIPHRAEVGPAGAHFALLATLVVEVLNCWPMLKHPRRALTKLISILGGLLLLGVLPWVDNYAHLFGFIFGFLAAYALMPFISFGKYDRRRKILLIWICLVLIIGLFALLLTLFYNVPFYECEICKLFNCIPFTRDFCASQNINFKKEEPV